MICVLAILYLAIGCFLMGALPNSAGNHSAVMLFFWPVVVPLLILFWAAEKIYGFGLFAGKKIRGCLQ